MTKKPIPSCDNHNFTFPFLSIRTRLFSFYVEQPVSRGFFINNGSKSEKDGGSQVNLHLKTPIRGTETEKGDNPNQCNQCDYACIDSSALRTHLKTHSGEKPKNATNVTLHQFIQAI